jgi:hypothetical protein
MALKPEFEYQGKTLLVPAQLLSKRRLRELLRKRNSLAPQVVEIYEQELARRAAEPLFKKVWSTLVAMVTVLRSMRR